MCAAPVLSNRSACFVNLVGTDDAGYNPVGQPWSKLTIAAALADLSANYPAATPAVPHIVALGPGTYTTPAFALPPNTFICADPDGRTSGETVINLTGNVTLSAAWSLNTPAIGGFGNLTFRAAAGTPVIDLTMPPPNAGNPLRTLTLDNIRHDLTSFEFESTGTGDSLNERGTVQDGDATDTVVYIGGLLALQNIVSAASVTLRTATFAMDCQAYGLAISSAAGGLTAGANGTASCTVRLGACSLRELTIGETGGGITTVYADAVSIPLTADVHFTGTATDADLIRTTDSGGVTPAGGGLYVTKTAAPAYAVVDVNSITSAALADLVLGCATAANNLRSTNPLLIGATSQPPTETDWLFVSPANPVINTIGRGLNVDIEFDVSYGATGISSYTRNVGSPAGPSGHVYAIQAHFFNEGGTLPEAVAVWAYLQRTAGTVTNAYGFKFQGVSGTFGTVWAFYSEGSTRSNLRGGLDVGDLATGSFGITCAPGALTGGTFQIAGAFNPTFTATATKFNTAIYAASITANTAVVYPLVVGVYVDSPTRGAASTITEVNGIRVANQTGGGTNYAIRTGLGIVSFGDELRLTKTITPAGTTGAQVINNVSGSVNFAAGAASLVVTNSLVTANSIVTATVAANDATMTSVQVVQGAGSFTLYAKPANPSAETRVNFTVTN